MLSIILSEIFTHCCSIEDACTIYMKLQIVLPCQLANFVSVFYRKASTATTAIQQQHYDFLYKLKGQLAFHMLPIEGS